MIINGHEYTFVEGPDYFAIYKDGTLLRQDDGKDDILQALMIDLNTDWNWTNDEWFDSVGEFPMKLSDVVLR